jgi:hypothetical protein
VARVNPVSVQQEVPFFVLMDLAVVLLVNVDNAQE